MNAYWFITVVNTFHYLIQTILEHCKLKKAIRQTITNQIHKINNEQNINQIHSITNEVRSEIKKIVQKTNEKKK